MSDPVTLARTARESLAQGLQALQGDANVPSHLLELAAPIAQAMGALHQIERAGGAEAASHAQAALTSVQSALGQLQAQPPTHPAVIAAIEAVAGALGSLHALTRLVRAEPAPQRPAARQPSTRPAAPQPVAPHPVAQRPSPRPPPQQPQPAAAPRAQQAPPAGDAPVVIAELGAHSPSNFYKGLSGNDIIDHGGLFVSTYKLPKLGQAVRLKVSMPGGYEFEANAVVRWRREASDQGNDAPPGFGAQFVAITPEARQLVHRYVRNREPLFHDDL